MKIIFASLFLLSIATNAQQVIKLHQTIPGSKTSTLYKEKVDSSNGRIRISKVTEPTLTIYKPENGNGTAIVICPGGGYANLVVNKEGYEVAEAFAKKGVTAFVLKYRLPNDTIMENRSVGPLQDAQQAIKIIRERAKEWNIDTARVGIIGFSAGGHLAATTSTHFDDRVLPNANNTNLRPSFSILVYPVISFSDSLSHKGSRRSLIGDNAGSEKQKLFSADEQVTSRTPPTFLVHAEDDKTVLVANSIAYYSALVRKGVKAELHIYPTGGHGFAINNTTVSDKWLERCFNWMKDNKWINE